MFALFCVPWAANAQESIPYTEGFENMSSASDLTAAGWISSASASACFLAIETSPTNVHTGSKALNIDSYSASSSSTTFIVGLPTVDVPINTLQITFSYKVTNTTVAVGYLTDANDASTFVQLGSYSNSSGYTTVTKELDQAPSEAARIAIKYTGYYRCYIDDIEVKALPTCMKPTLGQAENITEEGASFQWTENGSATNWVLEYSTDENFTDATSVNRSGIPSLAITGLASGTTYYVHVKSNSGNYSLRLTNRGVFAMPSFGDVDLSTLQLSMYVRQPNARYQLQVGVWDGQQFNPVALVNNASTGYEPFVCNFSDYDGSAGRIAFRNVLSAGGNLDYSYNYLDNIVVAYMGEAPACNAVTSLNVTETFEDFTNSTVNATGVRPTCWEVVQKDVEMAYDKYPQVYYNPNFGQGSYTLRLADRCVFAMPELEDGINLNEVTLTMTLRQPNTQYQLEVGVWEFGYDENQEPVEQFVPVATFHNSDNSVTEVSCDFASYTGTGNRIAFRNTLKTANYNYSYNYLDDITLTITESKIAENSSANVIDEIGVERYLEDIVVYPNPTKDFVNVQCTMNNVQCSGIEVIDIYGKVVHTVVGANNYSPLPTRINVSGLAADMYFVRVTTNRGVVTKPFVKR